MQLFHARWIPLVLATSAGLAVWALAAVNGYGWQTLWLPAVLAGVSWPRG